MKKLGVFICHCGVNIAGTVDVKSVAEKIGGVEDVAHSTDYIYMCSEPGQQIIREAVREKVWEEWWWPVAHPACMRIRSGRPSSLKG